MRNNACLLDTSGWIALLNTGDRLHASAAKAWRESARRKGIVVVTDWIIAETGNGLARTQYRGIFVDAVRLLSRSAEFRIVYIDEDLLIRSIDLYQTRPDKSWGLVDCASFVVMTQEGICDAITGDRHFDQAGFRSLLSDPEESGRAKSGPVG
jgi:uncharacterized protein